MHGLSTSGIPGHKDDVSLLRYQWPKDQRSLFARQGAASLG